MTGTVAAADTPRLWALVGATGTGKTALSLALAERLRETSGRRAEIVNADAMQLYRGMEIGTAKIPERERRGIPHHLFDAVDPEQEATVAWYQPVAREVIAQILDRGHHAILVGGSGLYVSSAIFDFRFPPRDAALRAELDAELERSGVEPLLERLRAVDPSAAASVDARNPRRVVRALEVALLGGEAQVVLPQAPQPWLPGTRIVGTAGERTELDRRVEAMWADGLLDEVRDLIPRGIERGKTASRAIGYAQALAQLRGELSEAAAVAETQALTRRYARRQVSWFKRYPGVDWLTEPDVARIRLD